MSCLFVTAATCSIPENGEFTEDVPADLNLAYLDTYTYSCIEGYTTDDELVVVCQSDCELSAPPPNCSGQLAKFKSLHLEYQNECRLIMPVSM